MGQRHRDHQREDQVRGQQGLDERQRQVPDRPGCEYLPADHAADPDQPPRFAQQVSDQPQPQESRVRLPLRRVLLEDEPGPDQQRGQQGEPIIEADVDVHGDPSPPPGRLGRHQRDLDS
jgi:hypothetical protein